LTALIAGGGIVTSIVAAAGFCWMDLNIFWERTDAQVGAIAKIVSDQAGGALARGDRKAANETLLWLGADDWVRDAVLFDRQRGTVSGMSRRTGCAETGMSSY
jgi:hypothetical protein